MKGMRQISISDFYCKSCNNKISLPRLKHGQREKLHIKNIYCPFCKKQQKFYEVRFFEDYESIKKAQEKADGDKEDEKHKE